MPARPVRSRAPAHPPGGPPRGGEATREEGPMHRDRRASSPFRASIAALALAAGLPSAVRADEVDDLLRSELQKHRIPAISVAVARDGQLIKAAAYGLANLELEVPATPDTVFQIQSITKTFTSAAVLLLMEEG